MELSPQAPLVEPIFRAMQAADEASTLQLAMAEKAAKEDAQKAAFERDLALRDADELKIEVLQWRKKAAVLRLKLASSEECNRLYRDNQQAMQDQMAELVRVQEALHGQLSDLQQQLTTAKGVQQEQREDVSKQQEELAQANLDMYNMGVRVNELTGRVAEHKAEAEMLHQQLAGSQLALQATTSRVDTLAAQLAQEQQAAGELRRQCGELKASLATSQEQLQTATERIVAAEGKKEVAEERAKLAERALADWKALDEDRRRMMAQHEATLSQLSQERMRLSDDRATVAEERLQGQVAALHKQLEAETGRRHTMESTLRQELLAAHEQHSQAKVRVQQLERQLADRARRVAELEDTLQQRSNETPARAHMVDNAVRVVDRLVSQLVPVSEGEEDEDASDGGRAAPAGALGRRAAAPAGTAKQARAAPAAAKGRGSRPAARREEAASSDEEEDADEPSSSDQDSGDEWAAGRAGSKGQKRQRAGEAAAQRAAAGRKRAAEAGARQADEVGPSQQPAKKQSSAPAKAKAAAPSQQPSLAPTQPVASQPLPPTQPAAGGWGRRDEQDSEDDGPHGGHDSQQEEEPRPLQARLAAPAPAAGAARGWGQRNASAAHANEDSDVDMVPGTQLDASQQPGPSQRASQQQQASQQQAGPSAARPALAPISALAPPQQQKPAAALSLDALPLFRSKAVSNPLAALNLKVMEAAAARRSQVSLTAKQALKRISLGGNENHRPGPKRKLLKPNTSYLSAPMAGDAMPLDMLNASLGLVPRLRKD